MRTPFLVVAAACSLGCAAPVHATERGVAPYLKRLGETATAKLAAAGVHVGPGLGLIARLDADGHLNALRITASSGATEADRQAAHALRRLAVGGPPPGLAGAEIKLGTVSSRIIQARAP